MKLKMLFHITLLLVLSAGAVQAKEKITNLYRIGEHPVYQHVLRTKADLRDMMRSDKTWNDIENELEKAECPGTATGNCSELISEFYVLFYQDFNANNFRDVQYDQDSVIFRWMMFRPQGKGRIKMAENINWGGAEPLPAYEFDIVFNNNTYTFAVPKGCGNLALLKRDCPVNPCAGCSRCIDFQTREIYDSPECRACQDAECFIPVEMPPVEVRVNPCKDCDDCSSNCKIKGQCDTPECQICWDEKCFIEVLVNPCEGCSECSRDCKVNGNCMSEKCRQCRSNNCFIPVEVPVEVSVNPCEENACRQCSDKCVENPYAKGCPPQCQDCMSLGCLRVVKVNVEVPVEVPPVKISVNPCEENACRQCSDECAENPYAQGCPSQCQTCKSLGCLRVVTKYVREQISVNPCRDNACSQCSDECAENPYAQGCPSQCQTCKSLGCLRVVTVPEPFSVCEKENCDQCSPECIENPQGKDCPPQCGKCREFNCVRVFDRPLSFIADLGYFRQSDPADYLFGRVGIEHKLFPNDPQYGNISLLTMIGAAPKVGGSDGDSAFLLDVITQYNWLLPSDSWSLPQYNWTAPALRGFTGLGLGGWFTSGDVEDDSGDNDLDIIFNIGVRLPNRPNVSIFLEMRNAVDELDDISEYGRFGAGVRCEF